MWTALDYSGDPVFWDPNWLDVVRWAEKQGGEFPIVFDPYPDPSRVKAEGDIDIHGDLSG